VDRSWHRKALPFLTIALLAVVFGWFASRQGHHTFRFMGSEFGVARVKSFAYLVWKGYLFRFPVDASLVLLEVFAVGIAICLALNEWKARRSQVN
jgi:hypothetical protein